MTSELVSHELLELLVCPESRSRLTLAEEGLVGRLNQAIEARQLKNRAGQIVEASLDGGLLRAEGDLVYPIVERIPVLLADEGIPLDQLNR